MLGISTLPAWSDSLARAIHPELNLTELNRQIADEVDQGAEEGWRLRRDDALAQKLLTRANTTKVRGLAFSIDFAMATLVSRFLMCLFEMRWFRCSRTT